MTRHCWPTTFVVLSFLMIAPAAAQDPPEVNSTRLLRDQLEELVFESQRAGFLRHDHITYIAAFAPDALMIGARGTEPGPCDWEMSYERIFESRRLRFMMPVDPEMTIDFETVSFDVDDTTATLHVNTTIRYGLDGLEVVGETYELRLLETGWHIQRNRWWPVRTQWGDTVFEFDATFYATADAEAEAARAIGPGAYASELMDAYRFPEAHAAYVETTELPDFGATIWTYRAQAAMVIGDTEDALLSYRRARELIEGLEVPVWVDLAE